MKSDFPYFSLPTIFLLVILLAPAMALFQEFSVKDTEIKTNHGHQYEMLEGWEYHWGEPKKNAIPVSGWKAVKSPINPPQRKSRTLLWLRNKMPYENFEVPVLLIDGKGVLLTFEAFIEDRMIYKFGKLTSSGQGNLSGISSHLIHLGNNFQGKTLTFKVFSDYSNIGIRGKVFMGSESDLIQRIIKKDFNRFVIGLFMVFIGVLDLIIYRKSMKTTGAVSMFGILAISLGLYTINITAIKDLIFYAPMFWFNVYIVAMSLIPVGAMGFIWQIFRPVSGNFYHRIWQFHLGYAFICQITFILILNDLLPMIIGSMMLNTLRIFLISELILIAGVCVKDAFIKGNILARVYLCGFVPIILGGVHDALVGLGKIESSYSFVPWALMFFIISLEIIKRQQNIKTRHMLKTYARELEAKSSEKAELIRDLHDGIGGVATSVKFLSEMGLSDPSIKGMKNKFSSISALSSDCLIEIGNFMHCLDEEETDWIMVVENLYRTGEKIVSPLGLSFDFRENIDPHVKKPNSVLFLNVLRIYKEALTNIIKHSEAEHVFVRIDITKEKLILSIKDDGKGFGNDIIRGRGLSNMQSRTKKLNGKLTIDSKRGTCLTLELTLKAPL